MKFKNYDIRICSIALLMIILLFLAACEETENAQSNASDAKTGDRGLSEISSIGDGEGIAQDNPEKLMDDYKKGSQELQSGEGTLITGIIKDPKDEVIVSEPKDAISIELYTEVDKEQPEELSGYGPVEDKGWQKTDEFNSLTGIFKFEVDAGKKYYVRVAKPRYLEAYGSDEGQPFVLGEGEQKELEITLVKNPKRVEKYSDNGRYVVSYFEGQEECADKALKLFEDNYVHIKEFLELDDKVKNPMVEVNTLSEGRWQGTPSGIEIVCTPWLLEESWDEHIQRAIAEHFVSSRYGSTVMPKWAIKGFGIYIQMKMAGQDMDCNGYDLERLADPRYDGYYAGACTFDMLESESKGFVTRLIKAIDRFNSRYSGNTNDGFFIKEIMSGAFDDDLTQFFVDNFGYKQDDLEMDYNDIKPQVEACPESCDDANIATTDLCQYSVSGAKCKNMVVMV